MQGEVGVLKQGEESSCERRTKTENDPLAGRETKLFKRHPNATKSVTRKSQMMKNGDLDKVAEALQERAVCNNRSSRITCTLMLSSSLSKNFCVPFVFVSLSLTSPILF